MLEKPACLRSIFVIIGILAYATSPVMALSGGKIPPSLQINTPVIFNGDAATDQTPNANSMVGILIRKSNGVFTCSGVLIDTRHVLTAAHCFDGGPINVWAAFGLEIKKTTKMKLSVMTDITIHPSYSTDFELNMKEACLFQPANDPAYYFPCHDIAILKLPEAAPETYVPMALGIDKPYHGVKLSAFGYGMFTRGDSDSTGILRTTSSSIDVAEDHAFNMYGFKKNVCQGDSGGPAVATIKGKPMVIGILSLTKPNCVEGIYTSTVPHNDWIRAEIQK